MTGMAVRVTAYGCRNYDINRLCRYDRRALDRKCDGCQRVTDRDYLESQGLWIIGISHQPLPRSEAERMATAEVAELEKKNGCV